MPPIIYNPTQEHVSTKMQGAFFNFKPDSMKRMDEDKARFVTEHRAETGLVVLPPQFESEDGSYNSEFANSEEGKALLEEKKQQGISALIRAALDLIKNNQVSLRKDMAAKYPEGDSTRLIAIEMSDGELKALELLHRYKRTKDNTAEKRVAEIQKMLESVGPVTE